MDLNRNRPVTRRVLFKSGLRANSVEIRHIRCQSAMRKLGPFWSGGFSKRKTRVPLDDRLRSFVLFGCKNEKTLLLRRLLSSGTGSEFGSLAKYSLDS
jgi:hypothetical protein